MLAKLVYVDGTIRSEPKPLVALTLIVRLWRAADTGILRGTIRLGDTDYWAPIQSNTQIEELARAWLSGAGDGSHSGGTVTAGQ